MNNKQTEDKMLFSGKIFALLTNYIDSPERASNAAENIVKIVDQEIDQQVKRCLSDNREQRSQGSI